MKGVPPTLFGTTTPTPATAQLTFLPAAIPGGTRLSFARDPCRISSLSALSWPQDGRTMRALASTNKKDDTSRLLVAVCRVPSSKIHCQHHYQRVLINIVAALPVLEYSRVLRQYMDVSRGICGICVFDNSAEGLHPREPKARGNEQGTGKEHTSRGCHNSLTW